MPILSLTKTLDAIAELDQAQAESQFEIARLLSAIKSHNLYDQEGYASFKMMVQSELHMSPSAADRYANLYDHYVRLKYARDAFIELLRKFEWRHIEKVIKKEKTKIGSRAIKSRLDEMEASRYGQINFSLETKSLVERVERTLTGFGMEVHQSGSRSHMSTSFVALLDDYERLLAAERRRADKPRAA